MSNTGLIIEERSRDIGDFLVGRLIPFRKKRMVGPFIFIDHMGPATVKPGHYMDIGEHPHIGLSTLTYLLEGSLLHKDSIGTEQEIRSGSVNWMTAGSGVVHTERTPLHMRDGGSYPVHGFQIWVALPKDKEEIDPTFYHCETEELPSWSDVNLTFKLVAGTAFGKKSPVPVYSQLFMLEVKSEAKVPLNLEGKVKGEIGILIVSGSIEACEETIAAGNMLVSKVEDLCQVVLGADTHVLIFGGEPFVEERFIYWNFVSSSKERIEKAKQDWQNKNFKMVAGEDDYIPLPR
jgi:redox-sensitive bicupin YhaK (pirin superfamily)